MRTSIDLRGNEGLLVIVDPENSGADVEPNSPDWRG